MKPSAVRASLSAILFVLHGAAIVAAGPSKQQPVDDRDRRLEVFVADAHGLPIPGAQVAIAQQQGEFRKNAVSSSTPLEITGLLPDLYVVRITAAGFGPQ